MADPSTSITVPTDGVTAPGRRPRSQWTVLASTSLAMFAVFLDTTILFVAFPSISASFSSVSPTTLSWVLNAYTIVFAALLIPAGRLADRVGRRRTFLTAVVIFTVGVDAVRPRADRRSPDRGAGAAGRRRRRPRAGVAGPRAADLPPREDPVAVAIWGAVGAVAGAAGPTLGALVVEHLGWRWAFFINLPVGIVSFLLGRRVLPEGREAQPRPAARSRRRRAAGRSGWRSPPTPSSRPRHGAGPAPASCCAPSPRLALVGVFVGRCARVPNPLLDLRLFEARNFRWANAAMLVYATGFNAMFLGNVLFLTRVWDYSIMRAGLAISVGPLIVACTAPFFGRLAGRIGQRRLLIPGGLVWASGGLVLLARMTTTPSYVSTTCRPSCSPRSACRCACRSCRRPPSRACRRTASAPGSAVNQAVRNLGATLGVALVIALTSDLTPATALDGFHQRLVAARRQRRDRLAAVDPPADARRAGSAGHGRRRLRSTRARSPAPRRSSRRAPGGDRSPCSRSSARRPAGRRPSARPGGTRRWRR